MRLVVSVALLVVAGGALAPPAHAETAAPPSLTGTSFSGGEPNWVPPTPTPSMCGSDPVTLSFNAVGDAYGAYAGAEYAESGTLTFKPLAVTGDSGIDGPHSSGDGYTFTHSYRFARSTGTAALSSTFTITTADGIVVTGTRSAQNLEGVCQGYHSTTDIFLNGVLTDSYQDGYNDSSFWGTSSWSATVTTPSGDSFRRSGTGAISWYESDWSGMSPFGGDYRQFNGELTEVAMATALTVTAAVSGTSGSNGWYASPVTVSYTCAGVLEGDTCPASETVTDGVHAARTVTVTSSDSRTATADVPALKVDATNPDLAFTGAATSYAADQQVTIGCTATDATSGVASSTCPTLGVPAWTLAPGDHTLTASATDNAGNASSSSVTFTVLEPDAASTASLVESFATDGGTVNALQTTLATVASAPNDSAKAGALKAFTKQVEAKIGKSLTAEQAEVLIKAASAL